MLTIKMSKNYLNLPIKTGADKSKVVMRDVATNEMLTYFDFEPGLKEKDFMAFYSVAEFSGKEISIEIIDGELKDEELEQMLEFSDEPLGLEGLYQEELRPQIHFTSRRGWLNDPNGLVYYQGKYHLFYQHNPVGFNWGNMHWGHAVSDDLFSWQESDDALLPDKFGTMYSGSGVVDWNNSSGLGTADNPPLVFFYTAAGEHAPDKVKYTQCLAYSLDNGKTLIKYDGNPIVPHIAGGNRDPKVIWHADRSQESGVTSQKEAKALKPETRNQKHGKWIMVLYLEKQDEEQHYVIMNSTNLIDWQEQQRLTLPGAGECPDFFPLEVDGKEKWVFWGADSYYLVGDFDGDTFTPDGDPIKAYAGGADNRGKNYAGQTYSDIGRRTCRDEVAEGQRRRIHFAWFQGQMPGMPFNQQMSLPVEMSLKETNKRPSLTFAPVKELFELVSATDEKKDIDSITLDLEGKASIIDLTAGDLEINIGNVVIDSIAGKITWKDQNENEVPFIMAGDEMQLVIDTCSVEIFANDGLFYLAISMPGIIKEDLDIKSVGKIESMRISKLKSIW